MDDKKCTQCGEMKNFNEYHSDGKGGKRSNCKDCEKKRKRDQYKRKREDILKQKREYYNENKDCISERAKKYYSKNREKRIKQMNEWRINNPERHSEGYKKWRLKKLEHLREYNTNWVKNNPQKISASNARRKARKDSLPCNLTIEGTEELYESFDNRCFITNDKHNVHLEHFIPLSIGHSGTLRENCYLMNGSLNTSKRHSNPFEWIKGQKKELQTKFIELVIYLSNLNGLTPNEYKDFVYWCFENPRSVEELKQDKRHSIEVWRGIRGKHLPLPSYTGGNNYDDSTVKEAKERRTNINFFG